MEYETRHDLSAHENMKRSREARRVVKLFVEACAAFGLCLEPRKVSLGWTRDYLYFVEVSTGLSACLEVSTYKVKDGTNYALSLHTPGAPDGRAALGEAIRKRGPLALCIQHVAALANAEFEKGQRCYLERMAAMEKLRAAGGVQYSPIHFKFDSCTAAVEASGAIHVVVPYTLPVDYALLFLAQGFKVAA